MIQIDKLRYQDVLSKGFRSAADKVDTSDSDCWEVRSQLKSMKGTFWTDLDLGNRIERVN